MREPNALISTDAVARDLSGGNLRVFDCTTYLEPPPPGSDDPYIAVPGRNRRFSRDDTAQLFDNYTASIQYPKSTIWNRNRSLRDSGRGAASLGS